MTYMFGTCWVRDPELVGLFFGITTRLILHRGFVQGLVSPYAVGLSMRNYSEIYRVQMDNIGEVWRSVKIFVD
jgi:hypothetical protein